MLPDKSCEVEVLLSTYNGEAYLPAQLASLLAQEGCAWKLLARDDGSKDATAELLRGFASQHPGQVGELELGGGNLRTQASFSKLLSKVQSPYFVCCDQDDVWHKDKIASCLAEMRRLEAAHGADTPLLVHSDLNLVDMAGQPLHPSLWGYMKLDPEAGSSLQRLLIQNQVTGCALMGNLALARKATPVPAGAIMHDWWLALVAAAFGKIAALRQPLIDYRQHGKNQVGAKAWTLRRMIDKALHLHVRDELMRSIVATVEQSKAFYAQYGSTLPERERGCVAAYAGLLDLPWLARRRCLLRHGCFKTGLLRNLALFARV